MFNTITFILIEQNWMQGWLYGKGLIYLTANISVTGNKINLPQGQSYSEGKCHI